MARRVNIYPIQFTIGTIPTTGAISGYAIVGKAGTVEAAYMSGVDAMARHASNYLTVTITNLGPAGSGTNAVLGAVDGNTTKTTTGQAIVANGVFTLVLSTTAANLEVAEGDRLRFTVTATGTLANTVTFTVATLLVKASGV